MSHARNDDPQFLHTGQDAERVQTFALAWYILAKYGCPHVPALSDLPGWARSIFEAGRLCRDCDMLGDR